MTTPPTPDPCATIDEVIAELEAIIAQARRHDRRDGFFAALYRNVTVKVKEGIDAGLFEDGSRMDRLDVAFANRYLEARSAFYRGESPVRCWDVAFSATRHWRPVLLQHLLLGMNAHINFDLGIAAAQTCPGDQLAPLRGDFDKINSVLASLLDEVQRDLDELSPWIGLVGRLGGRHDDALINFSMRLAREQAWRTAQTLAPLPRARWAPELSSLDTRMTLLANGIRRPGPLLGLGLLVVRSAERATVSHAIDVLDRASGRVRPEAAVRGE